MNHIASYLIDLAIVFFVGRWVVEHAAPSSRPQATRAFAAFALWSAASDHVCSTLLAPFFYLAALAVIWTLLPQHTRARIGALILAAFEVIEQRYRRTSA